MSTKRRTRGVPYRKRFCMEGLTTLDEYLAAAKAAGYDKVDNDPIWPAYSDHPGTWQELDGTAEIPATATCYCGSAPDGFMWYPPVDQGDIYFCKAHKPMYSWYERA